MKNYISTITTFFKNLNDTSLTGLNEEEKPYYKHWEKIAKHFETGAKLEKWMKSKSFNLGLVNDSYKDTVHFITRTIYKNNCGFCGLSWASAKIIDTFYEYRKEAGCEVSPVNFRNLPPEPILFTGWVSPTGDFYSCSYTGHKHLAENIMNDLYQVSPKERANHERLLEEKGYVKFVYDTFKREYNVYGGLGKELTSNQYKVLLDMIGHLSIKIEAKEGRNLQKYIVFNFAN